MINVPSVSSNHLIAIIVWHLVQDTTLALEPSHDTQLLRTFANTCSKALHLVIEPPFAHPEHPVPVQHAARPAVDLHFIFVAHTGEMLLRDVINFPIAHDTISPIFNLRVQRQAMSEQSADYQYDCGATYCIG